MKERISTDLLWSLLLVACIVLLAATCTEGNSVENTGTRVALNQSIY